MNRFKAKLEPVPHGGLFVVVPAAVAARAGLAHGARVRGTVDGVGYRSSLMKYSGIFHLGVHKATVQAAGVGGGERVDVTIELDDQPLPTDVAPDDLTGALARQPKAQASWQKLAPAVRRGYVKSVLDAKKEETRARRIAQIVETLRHGVPARRTWKPPVRDSQRR
ncbi:MAG TPA: YdeI/OmpD-associated family protein [Burkholderiaceae bacterium]|nr:YdeI/OmpD-associated family protein [Burkholderiaceae bacterium]